MGERAIWVRPLSVHPIPDSPDHGVGAQRVVDMLSTYCPASTTTPWGSCAPTPSAA